MDKFHQYEDPQRDLLFADDMTDKEKQETLENIAIEERYQQNLEEREQELDDIEASGNKVMWA